MSRVVVSDLHKHFPNRAPGTIVRGRGAIDGLDLDVAAGEFFVLLGPSGCGKTTTLRCIAGLEQPTSGSISIDERLVVDPARKVFTPPDRRDLGMMFQSYALWPHMTVGENIAYPIQRRRSGLGRAGIAEAVHRNLDLVGLAGLDGRYPAELSGGQQQRVALARAIAATPRLLLFDEPLSNLDAQLRVTLRSELRRIHDETGATSIYVTHDQAEALALADRIAVLRDGRVEQIGAPDEVFLAPASAFVAAFLGYENILPGVLTTSGGFRVEGWSQDIPIAAGGRPSGRHLQAAIRAVNVRFSINEGRPGEGPLGVLESVTYVGDRYLASARIAGRVVQGALSIDAWSPLRKAANEIVTLAVAREHVVALGEDDTAGNLLSSAA